VRRDHVAGGAVIGAGAVLLAVSVDLPFGTLASPGAGMLPKAVIAAIIGLGLVIVAGAGASPRLAEMSWGDLPHALRVLAVAAGAAALYTVLGFIPTVFLLLLALTFAVEGKPLLNAALFAAGVTGLAFALFSTLLRTPLPRGSVWF